MPRRLSTFKRMFRGREAAGRMDEPLFFFLSSYTHANACELIRFQSFIGFKKQEQKMISPSKIQCKMDEIRVFARPAWRVTHRKSAQYAHMAISCALACSAIALNRITLLKSFIFFCFLYLATRQPSMQPPRHIIRSTFNLDFIFI